MLAGVLTAYINRTGKIIYFLRDIRKSLCALFALCSEFGLSWFISADQIRVMTMGNHAGSDFELLCSKTRFVHGREGVRVLGFFMRLLFVGF